MKHDSVKISELDGYFNWHNSIHVHAHMCKIYLPALDEMEKYNVMGKGWTGLLIDERGGDLDAMTKLLWKLLHNTDIHTTKESAILHDQVLASQGYGCTAFYNICIVCHHPNLQDDLCPMDTPKHYKSVPFAKYVQQVENHVWSSSLVGHPYTKGQAVFLAISNIHPKYRDKFLEEIFFYFYRK